MWFGSWPFGRKSARVRRGGKPRNIALALQGGGSHGAFTWGVLDRLLEDQRLSITALSGASAGAINGAVLACGLLEGGREAAREALAGLWREISEAGRYSPVGDGMLAWTPGGLGLRFLARVTSPYQFNPLDLNPLRELLSRHVDFERLGRASKVRLFVSATNVQTGSPRIFGNRELSADVLLASACLPHIHQAVELDGVPYWDGGFTANPPILPLVGLKGTDDIAVVHIDAQRYSGVPVTVSDISNRLHRILTNAPLVREIQLISEMAAMAGSRSLLRRKAQQLALHHILPPELMAQLEAGTKLDTDWAFLTQLRDIGRATAEIWLDQHFRRLGSGSAMDLETSLSEPAGHTGDTGEELGYIRA